MRKGEMAGGGKRSCGQVLQREIHGKFELPLRFEDDLLEGNLWNRCADGDALAVLSNLKTSACAGFVKENL